MSKKPSKSDAPFHQEWERQQAIMAASEQMWKDRWESIHCPFSKVLDRNDPQFVAERELINGPWRAAKIAVEAARDRAR